MKPESKRDEKVQRWRNNGKFVSQNDANLELAKRMWEFLCTRCHIPAASVTPLHFMGHKLKSRDTRRRKRARQQAKMFGLSSSGKKGKK